MSDMGQVGIEGVPEDVKAQQQNAPQAEGWTTALQANQPPVQPPVQSPVQLSVATPIADTTAMNAIAGSQPAAPASGSTPSVPVASTSDTPAMPAASSSAPSMAIRASDVTTTAVGSSLAATSGASSGGGSTPLPGLDAGTHVQLTPRKSLTVDDQRYSLARIFVITFAAGLLFLGLLVGAGIVNQIINGTPSGQTPFFSFNDLLQLLTAFGTVVGTPLGFVVGYYFKGQEQAASSNATGGGSNPSQQ